MEGGTSRVDGVTATGMEHAQLVTNYSRKWVTEYDPSLRISLGLICTAIVKT